MCFGDYNDILTDSEKQGGVFRVTSQVHLSR